MPELPEVEVLVRHLVAAVKHKTIRAVAVRRPKVIAPTSPRRLERALTGTTFEGLSRRGKYLVFKLRPRGKGEAFFLIGHLGMTGRMYLQPASQPLPKHAAVTLNLGRQNFIYEDQRYFGRLTLAVDGLSRLGPEPLAKEFTAKHLAAALQRSTQPVKVKLLDQELVAGIGNIYASEALFRAGISPRLAARRLQPGQVRRLWRAIRAVLREAIACGSTIPLNFRGGKTGDRLFYYGRATGAPDCYVERLRVYDRASQPCVVCAAPIRRVIQAARSTFYCPQCQQGRK